MCRGRISELGKAAPTLLKDAEELLRQAEDLMDGLECRPPQGKRCFFNKFISDVAMEQPEESVMGLLETKKMCCILHTIVATYGRFQESLEGHSLPR
jgi:hypothetical protein